jgi:signal transduction histidine kinase
MTRRSLRFRLLTAAGISLSAALVVTGFGLIVLFEHHVERRIGAELETHLAQIVANITFAPDGRIGFAHELVDPRFSKPLSGLYWQIQDDERATLLRSRSLWDGVIELPADELIPGIVHRHTLVGPADEMLLVRERQIIFRPSSEARRLRIALAADRRNLVAARNDFAADMLPYLALVATVLLIASWAQVAAGLAPLDAVRRGVTAVRSGARKRLASEYPDEVMPLVDEMNELLDLRERAIERARDWTADLAHGLKTPLMALVADARRLRSSGESAIADDLDELAQTMRRRVDRELIRVRLRSAAKGAATCADAVDAVRRLVRTLERTPRGAAVDWKLDTPERALASIAPDDLAELLGNLMENAAKWADETVGVSVEDGAVLRVRIEDDGPGVAASRLTELGLRGVRLDERKEGSGLGLAIARDIVEAYHGALAFGKSDLGGLCVAVSLPAPAPGVERAQ